MITTITPLERLLSLVEKVWSNHAFTFSVLAAICFQWSLRVIDNQVIGALSG
jgi:hypothetical protein